MKSLTKITVLITIFFFSSKNMMAQTKFVGTWLTEDKTAKILIYEAKNGKYYGKIVEDEIKINIGKVILTGFTLKDAELKDGKVLDTSDNKTYDCKLTLINDNMLKLKAYWGMISHSEKWTKIN
jgi:uncharacterized protein (DUF2147 family)